VQILVADDDAVNRLLLTSTLKRWGHSVVAVADGEEAWHALQEDQFACVISDWIMPRLSGVDLCRRIRARELPGYVYVILLTSLGQPDAVVEGLEAGADDFIHKPFHENELRARLRAGERLVALERGLMESHAQLQDAYATLKEDLLAASQMQRELLPLPSATVSGVNCAWFFYPHTFVAGDTFNIHRLDETHVGFYVIDVVGHGVAAAMQSVTLSRVLSPLTGADSLLKPSISEPPYYRLNSPEVIVGTLNDRFQSETGILRYFTMVFGMLDLSANRIRLTQAGHPMPLHQRGKTVTPIGLGGFPVGMLPGVQYEACEFDFLPGDRLVLYSDGVTECNSQTGSEFSVERLSALLCDKRELSLQNAINEIEITLCHWRGSNMFEDDVTLFAIERQEH
jgi:sigma-B regulation protein RsbU (phosphoserine phosphatase)